MSGRRLGLILGFAAFAGAALANPPQMSPHPLRNPVRPMAAPDLAPPAAGASTAGLIRPKARPPAAQRALVVQVSAASLALPAIATVAPPEKPENLMRRNTLAAVPHLEPEPGLPRLEGELCGDPSIRGDLVARVSSPGRGCGIDEGVSVTSVAGVRLSQTATLDCRTARTLSRWVEGALIPEVGRWGGGVARIEVAASYACRPRNNQKGNKISEHGHGRAIDISGIVLRNGTVVSVLGDWGKGRQGKLLKAVRRAACGPFSTVLGPGSDRFHRDHLHLDTAPGRGPYCP